MNTEIFVKYLSGFKHRIEMQTTYQTKFRDVCAVSGDFVERSVNEGPVI